jgi:hypothetical protein
MTHRIWFTFVSFALVVTLSPVLQKAWAQLPPQSQPGTISKPLPSNAVRYFAGSIASASAGSFVLTKRDGSSVTIRTTRTTIILSNRPATFADIHAGATVQIVAAKTADGSLTAEAVQDLSLVPETLTANRNRGWQTGSGRMVLLGSVAGTPTKGTLTVTSPTGQRASVTVPSTARIARWVPRAVSDLTAGTMVMVQAVPNADESFTASVVNVAGTKGK